MYKFDLFIEMNSSILISYSYLLKQEKIEKLLYGTATLIARGIGARIQQNVNLISDLWRFTLQTSHDCDPPCPEAN